MKNNLSKTIITALQTMAFWQGDDIGKNMGKAANVRSHNGQFSLQIHAAHKRQKNRRRRVLKRQQRQALARR